jgi:hypothetical protein
LRCLSRMVCVAAGGKFWAQSGETQEDALGNAKSRILCSDQLLAGQWSISEQSTRTGPRERIGRKTVGAQVQARWGNRWTRWREMAVVCTRARDVWRVVGRQMELDERCRVWGCARARCVCKVARRVRTIGLASVRPISRAPCRATSSIDIGLPQQYVTEKTADTASTRPRGPRGSAAASTSKLPV